MRKFLLALGLVSTLTPFAILHSTTPDLATLVVPDCTGIASTTGTYFQNYEKIEYSPEGLLILHFKINASSTGKTIEGEWLVKNDECDFGNSLAGDKDWYIPLPRGATDFSIRFSSPTHYDIWNDASSTPLTTCLGLFPGKQGCSRNLPDYPDYYTFGWRALQQNPTGGPLSTLQTSYHPIILPPTVAPVLTETLPAPDACAPYSFTSASGAIFDNYERAEYKDGFLRVHYRMASPYNSGGSWKARLRTHDTNCATNINTFPGSNNASTTPYTRYFSLRFTSPTHYEIWNDELNVKETCTLCQGDIANGVSYVSLMGSNTSGSNYFRGTPYAVIAPPSNVALSLASRPRACIDQAPLATTNYGSPTSGMTCASFISTNVAGVLIRVSTWAGLSTRLPAVVTSTNPL